MMKTNRIDWEAVERDYRTGKFTQVELSSMHNVAPATVNRKIKADRKIDPKRWQEDLTEAVRQATNANLMAELVKSTVNEGQERVKITVLAAAEVNTRIILGHRKQAADARSAMESARSKLLALGETITDIREAATFVSAAESLSRTVKNVIDIERTAYKLDDAPEDAGRAKTLSDAERASRLATIVERARRMVPPKDDAATSVVH